MKTNSADVKGNYFHRLYSFLITVIDKMHMFVYEHVMVRTTKKLLQLG